VQYPCDKLNMAVVNFQASYGDKEANLKKIEIMTAEAAGMGAQLVLFPEMCLTGYEFYDDPEINLDTKAALAETIDGHACARIAAVTQKHKIYAVFGMPETGHTEPGKLFNSAVAAGPAGLIGSYRKIHPFGRENTWSVKGGAPFMFQTQWGPVAVGICYDTYSFPELMRYYACKGARLYLNPTAIIRESDTSFTRGYYTYLQYGVLSNHIYIASANLAGPENKYTFGGGSVIVGPAGSPPGMTYSACYGGDIESRQEGIFTAGIDLSQAKRTIYENNTYTGQPDYRPDLYKTFWETP
jgi:predicted amidohydrolase